MLSTSDSSSSDQPAGGDAVTASLRDGAFIVIAAYNEGPVLGEVIDGVGAVYPNVVVVDDGSSDETFDIAREHARFALRHLINRGQGAALQTGIEFALQRGATFIVTFDADGQHRVEDIARLLEPIVAGECAISLGSRFLGETIDLPPLRRLVLKGGVVFTRIMSGVSVTDAHNGLRAFSRDAAERISITADRMAHASELLDLIKATGLPFKEVPVQIRYTDYSLAKGQSIGNAVRIVFQYLVGRILG